MSCYILSISILFKYKFGIQWSKWLKFEFITMYSKLHKHIYYIVLLSWLNSSWSFLKVSICRNISSYFPMFSLECNNIMAFVDRKKLIHSSESFQRESSCKFVMFCWVKFPVWRNIKDGREYDQSDSHWSQGHMVVLRSHWNNYDDLGRSRGWLLQLRAGRRIWKIWEEIFAKKMREPFDNWGHV